MLEYYPDRTYKNSAGNGTIKSTQSKLKKNIIKSKEDDIVKKTILSKRHKHKNYINALISTRKTKYGYSIIVVRQPETSDEAYLLAKQLQKEMVEELIENNRFLNDYDGFLSWFAKKEIILKENCFRKLKG